MAYAELNNYMTDDVTLPRKVKSWHPIRLERNISKTAGDAISNNRYSLFSRLSAVRQYGALS